MDENTKVEDSKKFDTISKILADKLAEAQSQLDPKWLQSLSNFQSANSRLIIERILRWGIDHHPDEFISLIEESLPKETSADLHEQRVEFFDARILDLMSAIAEEPQLRFRLDPYDFQLVVAELLAKLNYKVTVQKRTRDKGVDVIAEFSSPLGKFITAVQCKRYAEERKVEPASVQQLIGVVSSTDFDRGLLVTTSEFGPGGVLLANDPRNRVALRDGGELVDLLRAALSLEL